MSLLLQFWRMCGESKIQQNSKYTQTRASGDARPLRSHELTITVSGVTTRDIRRDPVCDGPRLPRASHGGTAQRGSPEHVRAGRSRVIPKGSLPSAATHPQVLRWSPVQDLTAWSPSWKRALARRRHSPGRIKLWGFEQNLHNSCGLAGGWCSHQK